MKEHGPAGIPALEVAAGDVLEATEGSVPGGCEAPVLEGCIAAVLCYTPPRCSQENP